MGRRGCSVLLVAGGFGGSEGGWWGRLLLSLVVVEAVGLGVVVDDEALELWIRGGRDAMLVDVYLTYLLLLGRNAEVHMSLADLNPAVWQALSDEI